jgi:hypothetical protein
MNTQKAITGLILAFWLVLIGVTYWRMELRFLTPAPRPAGAADIDPTQQPPAPVQQLQTDAGARALHGRITLLNFWSPDCACSRFMEPHVRDLVARFQPQGVQFITVILVDDARASDEEILGWWRARGVQTPALVDRGGLLARRFGVWGGSCGSCCGHARAHRLHGRVQHRALLQQRAYSVCPAGVRSPAGRAHPAARENALLRLPTAPVAAQPTQSLTPPVCAPALPLAAHR